jgi:hypothetical protein
MSTLAATKKGMPLHKIRYSNHTMIVKLLVTNPNFKTREIESPALKMVNQTVHSKNQGEFQTTNT